MTDNGAAAGPRHPRDNPDAYIPGDRRRALARGTPMPDRVRGAALFADISGFTPLTEALANELGPHRGAEELTAHLNRVFQALIDVLHDYGGHVIYFSGDAITCWLDGDDGTRAAACGVAMQAQMARVGEVTTPGGIAIRLAMKVAVSVGDARRFLVGDPGVQRIDVLAGRLIDELASAEHQAERGDVLLGPSAVASLGDRADVRERRVDAETGKAYGVLGRLQCRGRLRARNRGRRRASGRGRPGMGAAGRLRARPHGARRVPGGAAPAYPLFVRFGGIDYDHDDDAIAKLDAFIRSVQRILTSYGGNLLTLTLGDKGAYLCAVFGAPLAHEDDASRAAAAALELRELESTTAVTGLQIGIAYGRLRSGTYGHERRRTFTCLGDAVNLAARLMGSAPPGQIYASGAVHRSAGDVFQWEALAPITVKGKAEPVSAFALTGSKRQAARRAASDEKPMVGRGAQLDAMAARFDAALAGEGGIVGISAEAGMGKSRLVAEFVRVAAERGALVAVGECQAYGTNTSYFVWREIWTTLFGLDDELPEAERVRALERELAAIDPTLVPRAPLLDGLLGLPIPDNELTAGFDAKLRKTSLEGLLVECLRARARATPLVLALEDCHWLDPLSRDLLEVLARAVAELRVLLVLAYRPSTDVGGGLGIESLPQFSEIALAELDRPSAAMLIRSKLEPVLGPGVEPPAALVELVADRAQGNPFYIEELLNFIRSKGVDLQGRSGDAQARAAREPAQPHPEPHRHAGRGRAPAPQGGERARPCLPRADAAQHLSRARRVRRSEPAPADAGVGRPRQRRPGGRAVVAVQARRDAGGRVREHALRVPRDAARARGRLHRVHGARRGRAQPRPARPPLRPRHEPAQEARVPRARRRGRAGRLRERLRDRLLRAIGAAGGGQRPRRRAAQARQGARAHRQVAARGGSRGRGARARRNARATAARARHARRRWPRWRASRGATTRRSRASSAPGRISRPQATRRAWGWCCTSRARWPRSAATIRRPSSTTRRALRSASAWATRRRWEACCRTSASSPSTAANTSSRARSTKARSRTAPEIGDRWALGVSMNNLGMIAALQKDFPAAREWFQKSMLLCREVGDGWMVAIGHNNLGNATRGLGDYAAARKHYAESLRAYREYGDRWALAFLLEDIGVLAALRRRRRVGARAGRRRRCVARGDRRAARAVAR